jgi:hypothetical protein
MKKVKVSALVAVNFLILHLIFELLNYQT